jgi:hypothetical protein
VNRHSHPAPFRNPQLTDIKAVQASASQANVQLGTKDAVAHAISDASADASLRPSTSLMLAEVMAGMGNGRSFSETRDISKLLEYVALNGILLRRFAQTFAAQLSTNSMLKRPIYKKQSNRPRRPSKLPQQTERNRAVTPRLHLSC